MENFKNLLNFKESKILKNRLRVRVKWDSNDADYIEKTFYTLPDNLFGNKKLIYCLAYISLPYEFKGHGWDDCVFSHHVDENDDIDDLVSILSDGKDDYTCYYEYSDSCICHSLEEIEITYYDENSISYDVTFDDIKKQFEKMSYEEICDFINNI